MSRRCPARPGCALHRCTADSPTSLRTELALLLALFRLVNRAPDLLAGDWHVDVPYTERRQGIDDRVHECRRAADIRALANPLGAHWMMRAGGRRLVRLPMRRLERGRYQIVGEIRV